MPLETGRIPLKWVSLSLCNNVVSNLKLLQKVTDEGRITKSAHPGASRVICCPIRMLNSLLARFSPDDKFSRHRVTVKKRYGVLLTQLPAKPM